MHVVPTFFFVRAVRMFLCAMTDSSSRERGAIQSGVRIPEQRPEGRKLRSQTFQLSLPHLSAHVPIEGEAVAEVVGVPSMAEVVLRVVRVGVVDAAVAILALPVKFDPASFLNFLLEKCQIFVTSPSDRKLIFTEIS